MDPSVIPTGRSGSFGAAGLALLPLLAMAVSNADGPVREDEAAALVFVEL